MKTLKILIPILICTLIFTSCSNDDDSGSITEPLTQREILMTIYNANPGVLSWDVENPDINTWAGVTTDASGNVTVLNLGNYSSRDIRLIGLDEPVFIVGEKLTSVPNEIWMLESLIVLDLAYNTLDEIPEEIGQLTNLIALILYENPLTNGIPQAVLNLGSDIVKLEEIPILIEIIE